MRLPRKPASLAGVKSAVEELIDYCKAITPKPSGGMSFAFDNDGYRIEAMRKDYQPIDPPFWCVQVGKEKVRVYNSTLARNGTQCTIFNLEAGEDYALLDGFSAANETYYAYLELSNVGRTYHPALIPDKMEAKKALCSDGVFAGDNLANASGNKIKIVAKVWTGSNGIYKIEQWPDRDDWVYIPDSWGIAALPGEKPVSASIDLRPAGPDATDHTPQGYVLELKDFWAGLATDISRTLDMVEFRQGTDNGEGAPTEPYTQRYCTLAKLSNVIDPSDIGGGDIDTIIEYIGDNISDIITYIINSGTLPHTDLLFSGSGTIGVGESGGNTDQDDAYLHIYNDGEEGHANFINGLAAEDGDKEIRSIDPAWFGELHINNTDGTTDTQKWTTADLLVAVTNSAIIKATAASKDLYLGTADNKWRGISHYALGHAFIMPANGLFNIVGDGTQTVEIGLASDPIGTLTINGKTVHQRYVGDIPQGEKVLTIEV